MRSTKLQCRPVRQRRKPRKEAGKGAFVARSNLAAVDGGGRAFVGCGPFGGGNETAFVMPTTARRRKAISRRVKRPSFAAAGAGREKKLSDASRRLLLSSSGAGRKENRAALKAASLAFRRFASIRKLTRFESGFVSRWSGGLEKKLGRLRRNLNFRNGAATRKEIKRPLKPPSFAIRRGVSKRV